jgi:hypothetical protein
MNDKYTYIAKLRDRRMTFSEIALLLGLSRQRVHQIYTSYKKPLIPALDHKFLSPAKRKALGLPTVVLGSLGISGGRDYIRELVRIRDKRTCQICRRRWKPGQRRFDVHHRDEKHEGKSFKKGHIRWDRDHMDRMITLCHKCHMNLDGVRAKMGRLDLKRKTKRNSAIPKTS